MQKKLLHNLLNLTGKTAIVTGGAMGIGEAIAQRLHEAGANITVADIADKEGEALAKQFNGIRKQSAIFVHTDVSNAQSVTDMLAATTSAFGGVDILVNNAGIYPNQPFYQMTEDDFMKVINVNLRGVFLCTKAAARQMKAQGRGGKIINVSSIDALHPSMAGLAHYDASKHGVWGFTKSTALELAEDKIAVNAIAPGGISTPGVAKSSGDDKANDMQAAIAAFLQKVPMKAFGEPDDIGKVALFLASDMASYITGTQVVVDGGRLLS